MLGSALELEPGNTQARYQRATVLMSMDRNEVRVRACCCTVCGFRSEKRRLQVLCSCICVSNAALAVVEWDLVLLLCSVCFWISHSVCRVMHTQARM